MSVKPEKLAVPLNEQDLMELESIVQDEDADAALLFLRGLRKKILEMQRRRVSGTA